MDGPGQQFVNALFAGIAGIMTSLLGALATTIFTTFITPLLEAIAEAIGLSGGGG